TADADAAAKPAASAATSATATASAAALAQLQLQAQLHPWRRLPLGQSRMQLAHINAQAFHAQAPATDLYGTLALTPQAPASAPAAQAQDPWAGPWQLQAEIDNRQPGRWDAQRLPVRRLQALLHYAPEAVRIEQATLELEGSAPAGRLQLSGQANPQHWSAAELALALQAIDLQALQASLPQTQLSGQARLRPAAPQAQAQHSAPSGAQGDAQPDWLQTPWQIDTELRNAQAGPLEQQRLPLAQLLAQLQIAPERWSVQSLQAHFGAAAASAQTAAQAGPAHLQLQGHFAPQTQALAVQAELQHLPLQAVHGELASAQAPNLSGAFSAQGQLQQDIAFEADIRGTGAAQAQAAPGAAWAVRTIQAKGRWQPQLLDVAQLQLDALGAKVEASKLQVALPAAERIEAVLSASAPGLSLQADAAMQQAAGAGKLALQVASAEQLLAWLRGLPVIGAALPPLQAQGALQFEADWNGGWQQWLQGLQKPAAHPQLRLAAKAHSQGLRIVLPAANAANAAGGQAQGQAKDKSKARAQGKTPDKTPGTQLAIKALQLQLEGNLAAATLALHGDVRANEAQAVLDARARMSQAQATGGATAAWDIAIEQLGAAATLPGQAEPWRLQVADGLRLKLQSGKALRVEATAGQASLRPPAQLARQGEALQLRWEPLQWQQQPGGAMQLQSRGQFSGLVVGWADALLPQQRPLQAAGLHSSLVLQGDWDIDMGQQLRVQAALQRSSGELWLGEPSAAQAAAAVAPGTTVQSTAPRRRGVAAGIKNLALRLQSQGEQLQATLDWDTERAGVVQAQVQTQLARQGGGWSLPADAPLDGRVQAKVQDLGVWAGLAPLGWRIAGALEADVRLAGTLQAPQLQGPIRAHQLNLRSVLDGVDLHDGRLQAQLKGKRLQIEELVLHGGTGSNAYVPGLSGNRTPAPLERGRMVASGVLDWSGAAGAAGAGLALDVKAQLEQMQVLVRNDRQMSLSGTLQAALAGGALRVRGDVRVDRAAITLPESQAPVLGDDVLVLRRGVPQDQVAPKSAKQRAEEQAEQEEGGQPRGQLQTAKPMDLRIQLDLGRDFALQGYGITTRLEGNLTVTSAAKGPGPVSVVGEIRTDEGRYRAWGQALNVERGVVRFNGPYANPSIDMLAVRPNIDVRAGVRVTGTAQAPRVRLYSEPALPESEALSWVVLGRAPGAGSGGGNAMQQAALGLLAGSVGDSLAGGLGFDEVGLSQSGVSIGKRLSDQLYITYEAGLSGAASTLYVFYDITRRLTARGQTGQTSAVDLIYTISYD
ncbi:MAG: translocation/assembly module TamB domain-containing protein, partial [Comamonadaceae bacterium]|nr:translocation/assembly module TamB domain-containing protein [Comamonadaceae bacterium]